VAIVQNKKRAPGQNAWENLSSINNLISTSLTLPLKERELKEATCEKCH